MSDARNERFSKSREIAKGLVENSIITDAAAQLIALILEEVHKTKIKPLQDELKNRAEPNLSTVAQVPEVAALIEALQDMRRQFSPCPSEDTERWREEHEACERADAAIAAFKEPKPCTS